MRFRGMLCAIAVITTLAACSSSGESEWDPANAQSALQHAEEQGYTEAADALRDGQVTSEEWASLHDHWVDCMEDLGFAFDAPLLDPVNQQEFLEKRDYRGEGEPNDADMAACDDRYDFSAGQIYYLTVGPSMHPDLLAAVRACLTATKVPFSGDESTFQDFFPDGDPQAATEGPIADCVTSETLRLFPDVAIVNLNF